MHPVPINDAKEKPVVLMIETAGIIPTGDQSSNHRFTFLQ
jgi:hypothetical protein